MKASRRLNFLFIIVGGCVALYANANDTQNLYILIGGILLLMIGLYRLSKGLSSKEEDENDQQHNVRL